MLNFSLVFSYFSIIFVAGVLLGFRNVLAENGEGGVRAIIGECLYVRMILHETFAIFGFLLFVEFHCSFFNEKKSKIDRRKKKFFCKKTLAFFISNFS